MITVSTGWQQQDYADSRFGSIGEPDATVEVQWSPTLLTQLDAKYIHEYAEDIDINSPGYTHNELLLTLQHELRRNFLATLLLSDDYRQLERSSRRFQVLDIGPRLQYRMGDDVTLGFTYDREQLDSNSLTRYSDDTGMITVKKTVLTRPELDREP
ncbi:MAG: outer membrane beta-barrel protein [Aliidongia sp.]